MKLLDRLLYYYSTLFALIITLGAIFSGFALKNAVATLLFLPVTLTFAYELARQFSLYRLSRRYPASSPPASVRQTQRRLSAPFRFDYFFAQKSPLFLATIALYVIVVTATIFRAGLGYLPKPALVSPIPASQLAGPHL